MSVPYAITAPENEGLSFLGCEISYGSQWVNLNDSVRFKVNAQNTLDNTQKSWRKITTNSPILGGDYLIHAVPEMVAEQLSFWVYGQDQTEVNDNRHLLESLFEQFDYRIRLTFNEYREYWRCQLADASVSRGQVMAHSQMAMCTFTVPRYPEVTTERIG